MRSNRHFLAIIALFIISLAFRFVPLLFSTLPFNIDGFPLVKISEDIIETGHWELSYPEGTSDFVVYNTKMPVMSLIISSFAIVFGKTAMEIAQVIVPFLSSTAIVLIYLIAFKITKNQLVSFFAGLALALNGFYVYLGAAVMKETVGLVILLLGIYLYQGRDDPRKRVLASLLLLLLTLTHHLTAWIAFIMVSLLMLNSNALHWHHGTFQKRRFIIDFFSGPFIFIFTVIYYKIVDLAFFNRVSTVNDIALFGSIFILSMILCITFSLPKKRKKPKNVILNMKFLILIAGFGLFIFNGYKRIFPGTIYTTKLFAIYFIPYLLLVSIAIIGLNVVALRKTEHRPFIAALLMSPFVVILFAMLKGFDAFTFILLYRSYDFIDFGLAICAGIGAGYLINRIVKVSIKKEKQSKAAFGLKASLSIVFLVICLSTVPLGYNGQEFFGAQDTTYNYEFDAMKWVNENAPENKINTDERLNDIMNPYFDLETEKTLPWKLKYNRELEPDKMLFMEDKWTDDGAQMSPMEPIVISQKNFDNTLVNNNIIYSTKGSVSQIYIVIVR